MEKKGKSINIEENIQTLADLGLSNAQAKIYLALLAIGPTSISKIAYASGVARPDTYRGLSELRELGIIEKIVALPTIVKPLPITDAIGILMLRRKKENIDLDKRASKLVERLKEKTIGQPQTDEQQFVLIQGDAIELEVEKLLEKSKENISIMISRKKILQWLLNHYSEFKNALERGVTIRIVTEEPYENDTTKRILSLRKFPNFEWRHVPVPPAAWFKIYDNREILLTTLKLDQINKGAIISNNPFLMEMAQNYFNSAWFSAIEPQDQKFKHDSRQFDHLFSNLTNGFAYNKMLFGPDGKAVDYIILGINNAFEKITGIGKNQLHEKASKVLPNDIVKDLTALIDNYWPLISAGKTVNFEYNSAILGKWLSITAYSPEKGYFVTLVEDITERKKAESQILEQKITAERYLNIVGNIILALDVKGNIILLNKRGYEIFGYEEGELDGKDWVNVCLPQEAREELRKVYSDWVQGKSSTPEHYENPIVTKYGENRIISWHNCEIKNENGRIIGTLSSGEDITERKKAEISLKENEEKYRHLAKYAPAAIYEINYKTLKFESVNDCCCTISGYSEQELLSMSPFDFLDAEGKKLFQERIKKGTAGKRIDETVVYGIITKNGEKRWVTLTIKLTYKNNQVDRAFVVARDITEQKKSEELLKESEEKFRNLAEDSPHMIFINKLGRIVYVNKKCEEILGYTKEEFCSPDFNFLNLAAPEFRELIVSNFKKHSRGQDVSPIEITLLTKDGKKIKVFLNTRLIKFGKETAILGTAISLTGPLKKEFKLRMKRDKLNSKIQAA